MASYETDAATTQPEKDKVKITFRFCRECSNMLYPAEDKINHQLMFSCRMCSWSEKADTTCIYKNGLRDEVAETPGNYADVAQDPTVGADGHDDTHMHAMYDDDEDDADEMMDSIYGTNSFGTETDAPEVYGEESVPELCTLCGKEITCPFCGKPSFNGVVLETDDPGDATTTEEEQNQQVEAERHERALSGPALIPNSQ